jgi:hypothetical protein
MALLGAIPASSAATVITVMTIKLAAAACCSCALQLIRQLSNFCLQYMNTKTFNLIQLALAHHANLKLSPDRSTTMVWTIDLSNGKKKEIISQLMSIKASLDSNKLNPTACFPINSSMRYETVVDWVRKLVEKAWWASDYKGVHKMHEHLFRKVNVNCRWAHHSDNHPEYHYTATDSNQQQLVEDLQKLLTNLGVLKAGNAAEDDAAAELCSALQSLCV